MAITALQESLPVQLADIKQALASVNLPGRFEVIPGEPTLILDVAHNPAASTVLANNLKARNKNGKTVAIFSALNDKDISGTIAPLLPLIDHWYLAPLHGVERACSAKTLKTHFNTTKKHTLYDDIPQALAAAQAQASPQDTLVIFGSFYTVAAILTPPKNC
jgi:dihydrofolate synthase/folylpolyglutamate synthase